MDTSTSDELGTEDGYLQELAPVPYIDMDTTVSYGAYTIKGKSLLSITSLSNVDMYLNAFETFSATFFLVLILCRHQVQRRGG